MEVLDLEVLDAIVQVAVLGAYADGHLAEEERAVLKECIATHAASEDECRSMLSFVNRLPEKYPRVKTAEREKRIQEVLTVLTTKELQERAFRLAVDVAAAHEGIRIRESQLLLQLMFDLKIDGELAQRLMRDTKIKQHGPVDATLKSASSHSEAPPTIQDADRTLPSDGERHDQARVTPFNAI